MDEIIEEDDGEVPASWYRAAEVHIADLEAVVWQAVLREVRQAMASIKEEV